MKQIVKENKTVVLLISAIWSVLSVLFGLIFIKKKYSTITSNVYSSAGREAQFFWLFIAIIIAVFSIVLLVNFIINAITIKGYERQILVCSLPFILLLSVCFFYSYIRAGVGYSSYNYFVGDVRNVWDSAVRLYPYSFVYTSELFLICFFVFPFSLAPIAVKILFESFVMGYVVYRINAHYKSKLVYLLYVFCLTMPFRHLGIGVERMHWYGFVYLFVTVKLYFDILEGIKKDRRLPLKVEDWITELIMIFMISLLTVWRREGIYLLLFGGILLIKAYVDVSDKERVIKFILSFAICELLVFVPVMMNGVAEKGIEIDAIVVHILGEPSLDRQKVRDELDVVDQYIDIAIVDKYNSEMGLHGFEMNWFDTYYNDGLYYMQREQKTVSYEQFEKAVISIIKKEPLVFIKSRIKAYYVAGHSLSSYNLFIPLGLILMSFAWSIVKNNYTMIMILLGVLLHVTITTLAMPASFFKYFFHMWLLAYVFALIVFMDFLKVKKHSNGY